VNALNVIYDANCPLCRRCREWLLAQQAFITLVFTPLQALDLEDRFPGVGAYEPGKQLVAIADDGGVYVGERAWIMCLYALEDYRELAVRLAQPYAMPFAERICKLISHNRIGISRALRFADWMDSENEKSPPTMPVCKDQCQY
jgi:predicted DCC family thiol-disulfide oxidoreductase YuxK